MVTYGQFCPVAKASEVIAERWTPLILRELLSGSSRFNAIRRGLPTISTSLLAKRLKDLTRAGVVRRVGDGQDVRYELTEAGWELYPIIEGFGAWGQRWVRSDYGPDELDSSLLMWDIRRFLQPGQLHDTKVIVEFRLQAEGSIDYYWLVVDESDVDLCMVDPGFEIDLLITCSLRTLTEIWMGDQTMEHAATNDAIRLNGSPQLVRRFPSWIGQHPVLAPIGPAR